MNRNPRTPWWKKGLLLLLLLSGFSGFAQETTSDIGNFYPFLDAYSQKDNSRLSYLAKDWRNAELWRSTAKAKLHELLAFHPDPAPLHTEVLSTTPMTMPMQEEALPGWRNG
jgi:hypothetical protein